MIHQGSHILEDPGAVSGDDGKSGTPGKTVVLTSPDITDYVKSPRTRL